MPRVSPPTPARAPLRTRITRRLAALTAMVLLPMAAGSLTASAATTIANGGFESANLSGWTASGPATGVTTSNPHSGTYAALLGSSSPTNGSSSIAQSFTAPTGGGTLSFWYDVVCPDTVTYDWATATLKDTTTGTTSTVLAKTCVANSGWKQISRALTAGDGYTLTLTSHDDDYTGDPTYTEYDDVVLASSSTNDFSLALNPSTASVTPGNSATATVSTAVTSGSAQTVTFSASGLPTGASASFNPASVTAGGSSTLTVTTSSSTPSGTSSLTITGTGTSATHTATFSLTVGSSGGITLTQVSTDPYTDTDAQHATEVEPDTFAYGSTIVSAFQVGRVYGGGSSNIGWATSTNNGASWSHGYLPGITVNDGGSYAQVSDAAVAYDAKHGEWMIVGLPIDSSGNAAGVTVNRSTDGVTWQNATQAVGFDGQGYDKQWVACDDTSTSPYYGNCYIEVDITSSNNEESMAVSSDGGVTWSALRHPADAPSGLGGQPLVQPNGTVVVPYSANGSAIRSFSSTNGGSSWNSSVLVSSITSHTVAGNLRSGDGLPSAEIDGSGKVYVAWQDCRFRSGCPANDIVYSTSTNGTSWSAVARVPIDATTSGIDHFIPGLGVDKATSGTTADLGLYYYFYPSANCSASTCQLEVGYIDSANGGSSWSAPQTVAGPFGLSEIAGTSQGTMVGDYISCSVLGGKAYALLAVGAAASGGVAFNESMYTAGGLAVGGGSNVAAAGPVFARPADQLGAPQLSTLR